PSFWEPSAAAFAAQIDTRVRGLAITLIHQPKFLGTIVLASIREGRIEIEYLCLGFQPEVPRRFYVKLRPAHPAALAWPGRRKNRPASSRSRLSLFTTPTTRPSATTGRCQIDSASMRWSMLAASSFGSATGNTSLSTIRSRAVLRGSLMPAVCFSVSTPTTFSASSDKRCQLGRPIQVAGHAPDQRPQHASAVHGEAWRHIEHRYHDVHEEKPLQDDADWLGTLVAVQPPQREEEAAKNKARQRPD